MTLYLQESSLICAVIAMNMPNLLPSQLPSTHKEVVMKELARNVPLDDNGLPRFVYRPDFIPIDILDDSTTEQERIAHLRNASVSWNYEEGFPALNTGDPVWHAMPWEPQAAYDAFQRYLEMTENDETPVRILSVLSSLQNIPLEALRGYYALYWWRPRAQAHDLFIVACRQKQQQKRIMSMNESQYQHATEFMHLATSYLRDQMAKVADGGGADIKSSDVIKLLGMMLNAQRVALGQSTSIGDKPGAITPTTNVEVLIQQLNQGNRVTGVERDEEDDIRKLLADPNVALAAQDVVIKLSSQIEGNRDRVGAHFLDRYTSKDPAKQSA